MARKEFTRRTFLRLSAVTAFGAITAACRVPAPTPVPEVKEEVPPTKAPEVKEPVAAPVKEAPAFAAKVKAGTLPPLEERLPKEPLVLVRESIEQEIGTYSDKAFVSASAATHQCHEYFLMLNDDCTKTIPNIAKSWKVSDDGKTFTLYLREGMKWSDGEPFTADDVMFWYEDFVNNEELTPVFPRKWLVGGERAKFVKVDDFTVEVQFAAPFYYIAYGINSNAFAGRQNGGAGAGFYLPKHFLSQFHKKYNPDADKLAKERKYENWYEVFGYFNSWRYPIGYPQLGAWLHVEEGDIAWTYEANPYYFKVDPEGNQLPYIYTMRQLSWEDTEAHTMLMLTGQLDYESWGISVGDWPVLKKNEDKEKYDLWMGGDCWVGYADFWLNENYEVDPELGEIMAKAEFRQALSHAINRDEIVEKVALGNGVPMQGTVWRDCSFYKPEWGEAFVQYDTAKANAMLDALGLDKRDAEGFRTKPSGEKLTLIIECTTAIPYWVPISELTKNYWDAVGIRTILQVQEWTTLWTRLASGEMQIFTWVIDNMHEFVLLANKAHYTRMNWWGPKWWQWFTTDGKEGIAPPDDVKALYEMCDKIPETPPDQVGALLAQIWEDQAKNIRVIGTIGYVGKPILTRKALGNVDYKAYADNADIGGCRNNWCEMWFWKE